MIENAKQAKAKGLSWLVLKFKHADGSAQELSGAFPKAHAYRIFFAATEDEPCCDKAAKQFEENRKANEAAKAAKAERETLEKGGGARG